MGFFPISSAKGSMGIAERRERERQMRRQQILDAAKKVFSAKGFSGATIESIAEEAELSPATLYLYFKNKDELYASLNMKMLEVLKQKIEGVYQKKELSPEQKITALAEALYQVYEFDPLILINVLQFQSSEALRNLSPQLLEEIKTDSARALRTIAKIFEDGMRDEQFVQENPIALADIAWSLFGGLVLWEEGKRGFDPKKNYLKPTLQLGFEILRRGVKRQGNSG